MQLAHQRRADVPVRMCPWRKCAVWLAVYWKGQRVIALRQYCAYNRHWALIGVGRVLWWRSSRHVAARPSVNLICIVNANGVMKYNSVRMIWMSSMTGSRLKARSQHTHCTELNCSSRTPVWPKWNEWNGLECMRWKLSDIVNSLQCL